MSPPKVPNDEQIREAFGEVGEALQRALVLSTDRIQSVLEDAVVRGRMTRRDAEDLASNLVSVGKDQAAELQSEFDALVGSLPPVLADAVDVVDPRGKKRRQDTADADASAQAEADALVRDDVPAAKSKPAPAPTGKSAAKKPRAAAPVKDGAGPTAPKPKPKAKAKAEPKPKAKPKATAAPSAREVIASIPKLSKADLATLREQEVAGKRRATVLAAIDKALA